MPKHRKRILIAAALLGVAVGLVWILHPRNEPKYRGRYLSDWMAIFANPNPNPEQLEAAKQAVQNIGTNGVPIFLAWLSSETPR